MKRVRSHIFVIRLLWFCCVLLMRDSEIYADMPMAGDDEKPFDLVRAEEAAAIAFPKTSSEENRIVLAVDNQSLSQDAAKQDIRMQKQHDNEARAALKRLERAQREEQKRIEKEKKRQEREAQKLREQEEQRYKEKLEKEDELIKRAEWQQQELAEKETERKKDEDKRRTKMIFREQEKLQKKVLRRQQRQLEKAQREKEVKEQAEKEERSILDQELQNKIDGENAVINRKLKEEVLLLEKQEKERKKRGNQEKKLALALKRKEEKERQIEERRKEEELRVNEERERDRLREEEVERETRARRVREEQERQLREQRERERAAERSAKRLARERERQREHETRRMAEEIEHRKREEEQARLREQERLAEERLKREKEAFELERAIERKKREEEKQREFEERRKIEEQLRREEEERERIRQNERKAKDAEREVERLARARAREEERLKAEHEIEERARQKELQRLLEERELEQRKAEKHKEALKRKAEKEEERRLRERKAEELRLETERIKEETRLFKIEQKCAQALERKRKEQARKELEMERKIQEERKQEMEAKRKRMEEEERYWDQAYLEKDPKNVYYDYVDKVNKDLYEQKKVRLEFLRKEREQRIKSWEKLKGISQELDTYSGAYADLYKSPSEPFYAQAFEKKVIVDIEPRYSYASEAYTSAMGRHDKVTSLEFGNEAVTFGDICLAGRLLEDGYLQQLGTYPAPPVFTNNICLLNPYPIVFNGHDERLDLSFNCACYVKDFDCAIGVELPIVLERHKLDATLDIDDFIRRDAATNSLANNATFIFEELLRTKGITHIGGTQSGLGDIAIFGNVKIHTGFADKLLLGARVQLPSAPNASMNMLWPINLGNDGCIQASLFTSGLLAYNSYVNPHVFMQGTFNAPGYVHRRIPRLFGATISRGATPKLASHYGTIALGNYYQTVENDCEDQTIAVLDTKVKGLADNVARVKLMKGPELWLRFGNLFEHVLARRGFLDLFYDLRAKWHDSVSGLNTQEWDLDIIKKDSHSLSHIIGVEYAYQFDLGSRIRLGIQYVVSGMNVEMAVQGFGAVTYSF